MAEHWSWPVDVALVDTSAQFVGHRPHGRPDSDDHVDIARDQFGGKLRQTSASVLGPAIVNTKVLSLDVTEFAQRITVLIDALIPSRSIIENAHARSSTHSTGLLRARRKRPRQPRRREA